MNPIVREKRPASETNPFEELKDFLIHMAKMVVDEPHKVVVNDARGNGFVAYEVICDEKDTGTLIGRGGKHADAIRTMLMAAGAVRDIRVSIQVISNGDK